MELKPGTRLRSATDTTEVVVVKAPPGPVDLRCGGHPMVPHGQDPPDGLTTDPAFSAGCQLGKRYADETGTIELLCTKAGEASLSIGDVALEVKAAKPLPSSD